MTFLAERGGAFGRPLPSFQNGKVTTMPDIPEHAQDGRFPPYSRKAGKGSQGRFSVQVYEAVNCSTRCEGCGEWIEPGDLFTRHMMSGGGRQTYPFCRECEPFDLEQISQPEPQ